MGHGVGQNAVPLSGDGSHSRGGIQRQLGQDRHGAESQELPILHGHVQGRLVTPDANNWEQYSVVILTVTGGASYVILDGDEKNATHRDLLDPNAQAKPHLLDTNASNGVTMLFFPHGNRHLQAICFNDGSLFYSSYNYGYTQPISVTGGFKGGERLRVYGIL